MRFFKKKPLHVFVVSTMVFIPAAKGDVINVGQGQLVNDTVVNYGDSLNILAGGVSYSTLIYRGGAENILSGGQANNALIEGGTQNVENGGVANRTQLNGGYLNVYGFAKETELNSGSAMTIYSGGLADDTTINSFGGLYVYGTANQTVINDGAIYIYADGVSHEMVQNDGSIVIASSGTAKDTISLGGDIIVYSGGTNINNQLSGDAYEQIREGGISQGSILNGWANQEVSGTSINTVLNDNSTQLVVGGSAIDTKVNGGLQSISATGLASGTILDVGQQWVNGTTIDTTINGGEQFVYGTTTNTTINGGRAEIYANGLADGKTIINTSGEMLLHAASHATDVQINGGILSVNSITKNTSEDAAQIDKLAISGGNVVFEAGSSDQYSSLQIGELSGFGNFMLNTSLADQASNFVTISQGNGNFGVVVSDSGKDIADHTGLTVNLINDQGGDIDFTLVSTRGNNIRAIDGGAYMYILKQETGKDGLDGNVWHLAAMTEDSNNGGDNNGGDNNGSDNNGGDNNGSDNNGGDNNGGDNNGSDNNGGDNNGSDNNGGDNNGSDNNGGDNNGSDNNGGDNNGSDNNGGDNNGSDNNGGDNNGSDNNGGGLITTPSTDAVLSLANAGLSIMRGEMDGLRAARHSLSLDSQSGEGSIWGHYLGKTSAVETSNGAAYKLYQNGIELGGDVVTPVSNGDIVTGGFVTLTNNNIKNVRGGTSSMDSYGVGTYATWFDYSGFYLDGTLKANRLDSKLNARMTNGDMTYGKWHQYALSVALEAGYKFKPVEYISVTPFARMTSSVINEANVKLNNGMIAKIGKTRSLATEVGSSVAIDFSLGGTKSLSPYLSLSVEREQTSSNEVVINSVNHFKNNQNGTSGKYGAGIAVNFAEDVTLYSELDYRHGRYVEDPLQGMAGIRISF